MAFQQHLTYQLANLKRNLFGQGVPERLLNPSNDLLDELTQYYNLKILQKHNEDQLTLLGKSFSDQETKLEVKFIYPQTKIRSEELERRINYLQVDRSRPEVIIRQTLERLFPGVAFPSVRPNFLRYPETGQNLEFDVYNEILHLAVEYNGIQHYEYTPAFHHSYDDLIAQQKRDAYKVARANQLNIDLLVIPYTVRDEDLPNLVTTWAQELGRSQDEIQAARNVTRCQENKILVTNEDFVKLWSIVLEEIPDEILIQLQAKQEACRLSPDELVTLEKVTWYKLFKLPITGQEYLEYKPYLQQAFHRINWEKNKEKPALFLLAQVLDLIKVYPGQDKTLNSRDLLDLEDELNALHPALVQYWPELEPIEDSRYFKNNQGRLIRYLVTDPKKKSYKPVMRFLDYLVGEYFGYHLEVVGENRLAGKKNYLLKWQVNSPLLARLNKLILL